MSINEKYLKLGWFAFLISAFGIILVGAYQIQCAYLGFLSRYENKGAFYEFLKFLKLQAKMVFGIVVLENIAIALLILFGFTVFPRWQSLFIPIFLLIFTSIIERLPRIIRGDWFNLLYFIY